VKIAILDCFAGISGDITLGALIDCGVPVGYLRSELSKLNISGWSLQVKKVTHHQIQTTHTEVKSKATQQKSRYYKDIIQMIESSNLSVQVKKNRVKRLKFLVQ
jgi:uncharacterized protein (DUF111 family)